MTTLYQITNLIASDGAFSADITFNPAHPVFAGHFPGKPIVPGVVLVEISAAIVSRVMGKELVVKEMSVIKFLQVIEPSLHPAVIAKGTIIEETEDRLSVGLIFISGDVIFAKLRGVGLAWE
jgi:3-hydroxyacyl-[acyl-carrier-protein] dehydratase